MHLPVLVKIDRAYSPEPSIGRYLCLIAIALVVTVPAKIKAADPTDLFLGAGAGASITSGVNDTGVGYTALNKVTTGSNNTAFGTAAMTFTTGSGNTAIGSVALQHNTT